MKFSSKIKSVQSFSHVKIDPSTVTFSIKIIADNKTEKVTKQYHEKCSILLGCVVCSFCLGLPRNLRLKNRDDKEWLEGNTLEIKNHTHLEQIRQLNYDEIQFLVSWMFQVSNTAECNSESVSGSQVRLIAQLHAKLVAPRSFGDWIN
jgi:hypothetical protein